MSLEYDEYLREHCKNVTKGLRWMCDNLLPKLEKLGIEGFMLGNVILTDEHDKSKYLKEEYDAYDAFFYGGNRSYGVVKSFDYAWLHHIHNNPHHWQYWVLVDSANYDGDRSFKKALEMPFSCVLEMIADWWSFSWKSGNLTEIFDWYDSHKDKMLLHDKTRKLVEDVLKAMKEKLNEQKEMETNGKPDEICGV